MFSHVTQDDDRSFLSLLKNTKSPSPGVSLPESSLLFESDYSAGSRQIHSTIIISRQHLESTCVVRTYSQSDDASVHRVSSRRGIQEETKLLPSREESI